MGELLRLEWLDSSLLLVKRDDGGVYLETRVIGFSSPHVLVLNKDDAVQMMEWLSRATL